jgi:exodeoxyribonuclease VII large subunit
VIIEGELANFRVSKNRWVYFDLKDDMASVRFFGTVYNLPGPLEDGIVARVRGVPRLHPQYGFSITIQHIQPVGAGSIRRASDLLQAKLAAEGLFEQNRKRQLPYPPQKIGLIASKESAAYADFMKILSARWSGLEIILADVQVQGEVAPAQIVQAVERFNQSAKPPEVLVLTRGGGSAEDLQAFSTEVVTRAVAASRIPTLVAIGHEVDLSLAELAADKRASTPSNAAEFLTPDRAAVILSLGDTQRRLGQIAEAWLNDARQLIAVHAETLGRLADRTLREAKLQLRSAAQLLEAINPQTILNRGYAIVRSKGKVVRSSKELSKNAIVELAFKDGQRAAKIE